MAIPAKPQILNNVIAHNGDKITITDTKPTDSGQPSISSGWPKVTSLPPVLGGVSPSREGFNGLFNLLSQHVFSQQSGIVYEWDSSVSYPAGSIIRAADGNIYIAAADNGADYSGIGAKNPVTERIYWTPYISSGTVSLESGGTGAKTAATARMNLGLGNVDNTSDADKPVSAATQTALDEIKDMIGTGGGGTMPELKLITDIGEYAIRGRYVTLSFLLAGLNADMALSYVTAETLELVATDDPLDIRNHIADGTSLFGSDGKHKNIGAKIRHYKFSPNIKIVNKIMQKAFYGNEKLESVTGIPDGITNMDGAFENCYSLTEAQIIPKTVTSMNRCFKFCRAMRTPPVLHKDITAVEDALNFCWALEYGPVLPKGITSINGLFLACSALNRAMLPDVTNILTAPYASRTLEGCRSLKTLVILADANKIVFSPSSMSGVPSSVNIYVKDRELEAYRTSVPNLSATWGSRVLPLSELPAEENIWNIDINTGEIEGW